MTAARIGWAAGVVAGAVLAGAGAAAAEAERTAETRERPLVQLGLLIDTSNSMDGVIKQAKTQLWSIVNEFATAKRDGKPPILHVALYQYGTPTLGADNGYVRQLTPLTDDLDRISQLLFDLKTNGGDEYCGWAIDKAVDEQKWSADNRDYKAIFIAGNEPFSQGGIDYRAACRKAIGKGIMVNTIHCAGASDEGWEDGARLADGRFMRIDANRAVVEIKAPQDAKLAELNARLNATYIGYGAQGIEKAARQAEVDRRSAGISGANLAQRTAAKASAMYRNADWELVDAVKEDQVDLKEMKPEDLPEAIRGLSPDERERFVERKRQEREALQEEIRELSKQRADYVAAEQRNATAANENTLGARVRAAIRDQAAAREFVFE